MSNLIKHFVDSLISDTQHLDFSWNGDGTEVVFRKSDDSGFDVTVGIDSDIAYLSTDRGYDNHWHLEYFENEEQALTLVFGHVRDLLSGSMRICEVRSNNKPFKWVLETYSDGKWHKESTSGLLFWNWFGKRSQYCYSNVMFQPRTVE